MTTGRLVLRLGGCEMRVFCWFGVVKEGRFFVGREYLGRI